MSWAVMAYGCSFRNSYLDCDKCHFQVITDSRNFAKFHIYDVNFPRVNYVSYTIVADTR